MPGMPVPIRAQRGRARSALFSRVFIKEGKDCISAQTWADQLLGMKLPQLPLRLEEARGWKTAGFGHHQTGVVSHHNPWQLRQQGGGGVLTEMADCWEWYSFSPSTV